VTTIRRRSCIAGLIFIFAFLGSAFGQSNGLYYLYQRTTYLENLTMNGAWWANPALTGEIAEKTASTVNVTPIGLRQFTIVSAKYLFPFGGIFGGGFGIMGEGVNQNQSTQLSNRGATYSSHFSFSNPSLQFGLGMRLRNIGSAGLLLNAGQELLQSDGTNYNYPVVGCGVGALTPYFFNTISLSFTTMATWHFWQQAYMDNDAKAGIRFRILDDFILGSFEYAFSFKSGLIESESFYTTSNYCQIAKGLVSIRIYKIAGIILGYSSDFDFNDMGGTMHAGLELRPSDDYPYFGGYEIGLSTYQRVLFIHQIWVGYCFRAPKKT
jgi:hypothetical protein